MRKACYARANHVCEICGGKGTKHPVECHEIWHFDDTRRIQRLDGLISLCPSCHRVKHIGLAFRIGKGEQAIRHMAKVNKWPVAMADAYAVRAFEIWKLRSDMGYTLDLSWLDSAHAYIDSAAKSKRQTTSDRAQQALRIIEAQRAAQQTSAADERTARPTPTHYGAWS